jgi:hypothetical protein
MCSFDWPGKLVCLVMGCSKLSTSCVGEAGFSNSKDGMRQDRCWEGGCWQCLLVVWSSTSWVSKHCNYMYIGMKTFLKSAVYSLPECASDLNVPTTE